MRPHPVVLAVATAVLTACGAPMPSPVPPSPSSSSPSPAPSPSVDEAAARVEQHVRDVAASIPGAGLEIRFPAAVKACTQPVAGGPPGQVSAGVGYRITGLSPERNTAAFDTARRYWSDHGFRILVDARPNKPYLYVEAPAPDFTTLSLQESVDGTHLLFVLADSPCLLPTGPPA